MRGSPHTYPLRSELLTDSQERIASNILADRLQELVKLGIIVKSHDPSHKQKVIGHGQRLKPVPAIRRIELLITFRHEAQA